MHAALNTLLFNKNTNWCQEKRKEKKSPRKTEGPPEGIEEALFEA
jgi:hypothetical protein